eukprot:TRINITY_DN2044_c0_g1_i1.p1 TRINITY_DN2044_c0_g1~~TRINITY_DN2044_c0_g1_i1.p1  ORF type:complete len:135 (+),score=52.06 TRINITY_DN2044_c0_g1_i1:118-522(+)
MEYQDWTEVVIKKKKPKAGAGVNKDTEVNKARQQGAPVESVKKFNAGTNKQHAQNLSAKKLEADDEGPPKVTTVSLSMSQKIQQARNNKGWNRKQLAQEINEQVSVVESYENGKAIPNNQILSKMERALGAKLR